MFDKIGHALDAIVNFIEYLKQNSFIKITKYVLYLAIWIMILVTAANYTQVFGWIYDTATTISDDRHDALTAYRIKIGPEIEEILKDMCIEANGTRSFILEFHNGTNNPSGLPFYYMNMTYEWTDLSKTYSGASEWNDLLISRFSLVSKCFTEGVYVGSVDEIMQMDQALAYKLKSADVKHMGCILLYGDSNKPLGILGVSTGEDPNTTCNQVKTILFKYSQRLVKLLDANEIK